MWFVWLLAGIAICVGLFLFIYKDTINIQEFGIGSLVAIISAAFFHFYAVDSLTKDYETWSLKLHKAVHYPYWHAYWTTLEPVYTTDSKGNTRISHYETVHHHEDHPEHWTAYYSGGTGKHYTEGEFEISQTKYEEILINFSSRHVTTETPSKPDFDHGDRNIYVAYQKTGYDYPVTIVKKFKNKVKATPSLFQFAKVPENIQLPEWPHDHNRLESSRLIGSARSLISIRDWDLMNSKIGPWKKVNVIIVGFPKDTPLSYAQYLQAKWIGGKKNDLVLCYGGGSSNSPPTWSYVFGWTDKEIVKKNLQTVLLDNSINSGIVSLVEDEIVKNYEIKEWRDFDYLQVPVPGWLYWVYPLFLIFTQGGLYIYFHKNEF